MGRPRKYPETKEPVKMRRTYKTKNPLTENQVRKAKIQKKKEEQIQQLQTREMLADLYKKNIPTFIQKRREEFDSALTLFVTEYEDRIAMQDNKIPQDDLEYLISKPLITISAAERRYSAADLLMFNECYWECVRMANKVMGNTAYVPTLQQLSGLMSMPQSTFTAFYNSNDKELANAAEIVKDRFINYYTVNGMTNRINSILVIFTLKAGYGMRDNDAPQVVVNNTTTTLNQDDISALEAKYNFDKIIDINEI